MPLSKKLKNRLARYQQPCWPLPLSLEWRRSPLEFTL